jgi:RNA polymerase sigma factor (TIGR02999 family)
VSDTRGSPAGEAPAAGTAAVTQLLVELRRGVPGSLDRLMAAVYADLSRIAHRQLALEPVGHTLSTTGLVHEAYLRLVDQTRAEWTDRGRFFGVAACVMRRVLVDHARRHRAARRGGPGLRRVSLDALEADPALLSGSDRADLLVAIDAALTRLAELDARQARVVECRFFGGLSEAETADALGVSTRTLARDWVKARAWLHQELADVSG